MKTKWQKVDEAIKKELIMNTGLNDFLKPIFIIKAERQKFIKKCLEKINTRRMLLHAQWYTEIADGQDRIGQSRPALKLIFLMSLAEAITKLRIGKVDILSFDAIKEFFKFISNKDKVILNSSFRRALLNPGHHNLRFSSILKVLYNIRNSAVHGEDYFSFSLIDQKTKKAESNLSLLTSGYVGSRKRKRRIPLDIRLTYEELRDIFRKTAVANIESLLR